jgi:soluble lytic murein transglycosylase-like protein
MELILLTSIVIGILYSLNKLPGISPMSSTLAMLSGIRIRYGLMIDYLASKYAIDNGWVIAIIAAESEGNPNALGGTPDVGLMQLTAPALLDFNVFHKTNILLGDLTDTELNLNVGVWYLANLYHNHAKQNWFDAVRMYNVGIGRATRNKTAGLAYYNKVKQYYDAVSVIKGC